MFINWLYVLCYPLIDALHKYLEYHNEKKKYNNCFRIRVKQKENTKFKCSGVPERSEFYKDLMMNIKECENCPYFNESH